MPTKGERTTITKVHAFNEVRILEERGRQGWRLVGVGLGRLDVEYEGRPCEHLRVAFASPAQLSALREAGWEVAGKWAFLTYLWRPSPEPRSDA